MADQPQHRAEDEGDAAREGAGAEARPRGVFGNLPKHRPGTRSPRRAGEKRPKPEAQAASEQPAEPEAQAEPEAGGDPLGGDLLGSGMDPLGEEPRAHGATKGGSGGRGLNPEDLVWGAIAIGAQAATLGVRLANRALGALLERPERR